MYQNLSSEEYMWTRSWYVNSLDSQKLPAEMLIKGHDVQFPLDSGATVNVLPE